MRWALVLMLLAGCAGPTDPGFAVGDDDDAADDDEATDDDDATEVPWMPSDLPPCPGDDCVEPGLQVTWTSDPGRPAPCIEGDDCDEDYRDFLVAAAAFADPWPPGDLDAAVAAIGQGTVPLEGPPDDLEGRIRQALGVDFVLDGLDGQPHTATEIGGSTEPWGTATQWLVEDPWLGTLEFWLLMPEGGVRAGVVAYPGHGENVLDHRSLRFGDRLAEAGFAVAVMYPRAYDAWTVESAMTQDLLQDGFSLLGLRVAEIALVHKLLRAHGRVHPERIAAMGHSGGSLGAVLAARLLPELRGAVLDLRSDFHNVTEAGIWLDETIPELFPVHEHVFDFGGYPLPTYEDDYAFPEGFGPVRGALAGWLWAP